MNIAIQLFGPQARLAGVHQVVIAAPSEQITCEQLLDLLRAARPELADSLRDSRLAVNHAFANPETQIQPGDEVALIGLVSGG